MERYPQLPVHLAIVVCLCCWVGCESVRERTDALKDSSSNLLAWHKSREKKKRAARPEKMVAIWSESVGYGPGQNPTRGLGGRIYLYNSHHLPVKVDGELIIYAYDDGKGEGDSEDVKPDRRYRVSAEELARHYSPSEFGPSYSIWIPWDEVGNETRPVSIVPVFRDTNGQVVVGDHSRTLLPGKSDGKAALAVKARPHQKRDVSSKAGGNVRTVSYEESQLPTMPPAAASPAVRAAAEKVFGAAAEESRPAAEQMTTTSIFVPRSTQDRLVQARSNVPRQGAADPSSLWSPIEKKSAPKFRLRPVETNSNSNQASEEDGASASRDAGVVMQGSSSAIASRPSSFDAPRRTVGRQPFRPQVPISQWPTRERDLTHVRPSPQESRFDRSSLLEKERSASATRDSNDFLDSF